MSQGYSSGGNQKGSTPLSSQIYSYDNFQGSFANFIQKEMSSYLNAKEANTENVIAAFNNVIENIKNTYKQANNLGEKETSPALEKLIIELNSIPASLKAIYKDSMAQFQNQGTLGISEVISRNPDVAASLKDIKGAKDSKGVENKLDEKGANDLAKLKDSPIEKLLVHAKTQNGTLDRIEKILSGIAITAGVKIPTLLTDIDAQNDKDANAKQAEEEDWFAGLGSTISKTIFNHPGVNKLGLALGQLGNLALIKGVLSNRQFAEDHPVLHKAAALAVYFQLPQLAVNLMGVVFQQAVSNWLVKSIGPQVGQGLTSMFKTLGPQLGNIFKGAMNPVTIGVVLILAGIAAGIKGIIDHHKNMKNIDAEIDNDPRLSKNQKELAKMGEHSKSGAKVGRLSGALTGAGAGAIWGATAGAAFMGVGAIPGAIIGGIGGLLAGLGLGDVVGRLIGGLKPAFALIGNLLSPLVNIVKGTITFLRSVLSPFVSLFKTFVGMQLNALKGMVSEVLKGASAIFKSIFAPVISAFGSFVRTYLNYSKWVASGIEKVLSFVKPILKFIGNVVAMLNPISLMFKLIKTVMDGVKAKFHLGSDNPNSSSNPNNVNPFGDNHPTLNNIANTVINKSEAEAAKGVAAMNGNFETVSMRSLGLNGQIASINSIPHIAKKNVDGLRQLDGILKSWGYDTVYTSAMGGHSEGGHVKGNKVDFQLLQNGKTAHLSDEQLNYLQSLGYWGGKTGALGWEKVAKQRGGGHYDINTSNVKITEPYVKAFEEEKRIAKEKAEEEKRKKEEEKNKKKDDGKQAAPNIIDRGKSFLKRHYEDITGTDKAMPSFTEDKTKIGGNG